MIGMEKCTLMCGELMIGLNHLCHHTGLVWLCFNVLNLKSLLNKRHTTKQRVKQKHCLGPRPNEPTEQQQAQHNLTHLPYRSWCEHRVRAKGKERQSKRNTDREPVIQVDYLFVSTGKGIQQQTVLNAIDVQIGLSMSAVVPSKGRQAYSTAELKKFIYETGRTCGILQYDQEPSLKALVTETVNQLGGMSTRATPKDWKQAHGSIGRLQQTLLGQARTLRLQLQEHLGTEITSNDCIFPWIVKHANSYWTATWLTRTDKHLIFADGRRTIKLDFASLEKLFCSNCLETWDIKLALLGMRAFG